MGQHAKNTPSTHFCLVYLDNMIHPSRHTAQLKKKQLQTPLANRGPLNMAVLLEKNMVAWRGNSVVS